MKNVRSGRVSLALVLGPLVLAGCAETGAAGLTCDEGAVPVLLAGAQSCVVSVVETGFLCAADVPYAYPIADGLVCSSRDDLDADEVAEIAEAGGIDLRSGSDGADDNEATGASTSTPTPGGGDDELAADEVVAADDEAHAHDEADETGADGRPLRRERSEADEAEGDEASEQDELHCDAEFEDEDDRLRCIELSEREECDVPGERCDELPPLPEP
ncbi:MAG: hypothetical protein H6700_10750 [Myxococcales bacterium]|nr:hypothetical protein [Myxococcales bacterium]MCB9520880.1 hypothetical protein [Myxococcales bacterium]MCB9532234.1 hypothetical protein [Myxococcales bacterium]